MLHSMIKILLILAVLSLSNAFQTGPMHSTRLETQLKAWSLPVPETPTPFGKWYQECDAITRNRKYEDTPFEYNYVPVFDDSAAARGDSVLNNLPAQQHQTKVPVAMSFRKAALFVRRVWAQKN